LKQLRRGFGLLSASDEQGNPPQVLLQWRNSAQEQHDGAGSGNRREESRPKRRRVNGSWQSVATRILRPPTLREVTTHFRRRLDKFAMQTLPGHRVQRVTRVVKQLHSLVAPRVVASYIRTVCDGWATLSRFQCRGLCRFGCGNEQDSISHIARCPRAAGWAFQFSQLRRPPVGWELDYLFCMTDGAFDTRHLTRPVSEVDDVLQARALHLYALYRLHNGVRNNNFVNIDLEGGYRGFLREGRLAFD